MGTLLGQIGLLLLSLGMLSGILGFIGPNDLIDSLAPPLGMDPQRIERPIGELKGVLLDRQARIYTLDSAYRRLQYYEADGRFIGSWKIPLNFKIIQPTWKLDANDRLHYSVDQQHFMLDPQSGFKQALNSYARLPEPPPLPWTIKLHRPALLPRISKVTPQGEITLIQSKIHVFGILSGPLLGWLVSFVCGALLGLLFRQNSQGPMEVQIFGMTLFRR